MTGQAVGRFSWTAHRLAEVLLIGTVIVAPWFFGSVQSSVQVWLYVPVLAALVLWLTGHLAERSMDALPVAIVPLLAALALGGVQLLPLDRQTHAMLSPQGAALGELLSGEQGAGSGGSLSLYPAGTRRDLALLALVVSTFFLGTRLFQSPRIQQGLYALVAVNGTCLVLFGLAQKLTWNNRLYWTVPLRQSGGSFGPFVNQNNAGGYLNLCLARRWDWSSSLCEREACRPAGTSRRRMPGCRDSGQRRCSKRSAR